MRASRWIPILLVIAACGRNPNAGDTSPRRERNVMRITEIQEGASQGLSNVYDLVARYHPEWLRLGGINVNGQASTPTVYMDLQAYGGLASLRGIPLSAVTSVRLLSASEARGEFGITNPSGAIVVSTR